MRWTTLGYHHDWDNRQYAKESKEHGKMPDILIDIGKEISEAFELKSTFNSEASICNYYPANVGTIGIHRDDSGKSARSISEEISYRFFVKDNLDKI